MAGVEELTRANGGSKGRVSVPRGTMGACGGVKGREGIPQSSCITYGNPVAKPGISLSYVPFGHH